MRFMLCWVLYACASQVNLDAAIILRARCVSAPERGE